MLIGFSIIFTIHFGGNTPIFGNIQLTNLPLFWSLTTEQNGQKKPPSDVLPWELPQEPWSLQQFPETLETWIRDPKK